VTGQNHLKKKRLLFIFAAIKVHHFLKNFKTYEKL